MTGTPRIEFAQVWKKFARGELHDSLRDMVPAAVRRLAGRAPARDELSGEEFWAVRDVSFEVRPGEALGILGPNGAGKSTILKLLTRILVPTRGHCSISGRAGALIEVAAGFHPDLTGRENVFLQGAILGMKRRELTRRFDEIVAFAEIDAFIDTPVKRYSNGMNARLGFAIAAHISPDVLVIDEVLSVGDLRFQQKAFDRIEEMCTSGIPVVLVSHQLERIASLCTHAVLLERGRVARRGTPTECIEAYLESARNTDGAATHTSALTFDTLTQESPLPVRSGERALFRLTGAVANGVTDAAARDCTLRVRALSTGRLIFSASACDCGAALPAHGPFEMDVELQFNVVPGVYSLELAVWDAETQRDVVTGPGMTLKVEPGALTFSGTSHLLPRVRVASTAPSAAGASR
ncbi:MAG TPA: ABC transporter ATP-binding protein [Gemmatimonadaceae bacterium]|nr:ABC transporter ATP-binding protein [Gemmatimonadaceae bacterium]